MAILLSVLVVAIAALGVAIHHLSRRPTALRELASTDVHVRFSPPKPPPPPPRRIARGTARRRLPGLSGTAELAAMPARYPRCNLRIPPKDMDFSDEK